MGLFFNYDKPGPGVDKNAPKKKGVALYFELLGLNLSKLMIANMLYFVLSLPISILYFVIVSYFLSWAMPEAVGTMGLSQVAVILTLLIVILWGTGPVSCGYTYILRNAVKEKHTFLGSDFFEKSKDGFIHGLVFLIVDIVVFICSAVAILVYGNMAEKSGGIYIVLLGMAIITLVIYTIIHFYMYEIEVTFENDILQIYKNSFLMAIATFPMCLLIVAIICLASFVLLSYLTPLAAVVVGIFIWISLMRSIVDFYTTRFIEKNILHNGNENSDIN